MQLPIEKQTIVIDLFYTVKPSFLMVFGSFEGKNSKTIKQDWEDQKPSIDLLLGTFVHAYIIFCLNLNILNTHKCDISCQPIPTIFMEIRRCAQLLLFYKSTPVINAPVQYYYKRNQIDQLNSLHQIIGYYFPPV